MVSQGKFDSIQIIKIQDFQKYGENMVDFKKSVDGEIILLLDQADLTRQPSRKSHEIVIDQQSIRQHVENLQYEIHNRVIPKWREEVS